MPSKLAGIHASFFGVQRQRSTHARRHGLKKFTFYQILSLMPTDFSERSRQKSVFAYISGLHPNPGGTQGFNTIQCIPLSVLRTSRSFLSSGNVNGRRVSLIHHPASVFDLDMIQDHNLSDPTPPRQRSSRILSLTS